MFTFIHYITCSLIHFLLMFTAACPVKSSLLLLPSTGPIGPRMETSTGRATGQPTLYNFYCPGIKDKGALLPGILAPLPAGRG